MLVLKRKEGQSIIIGGEIVVKIIEVEGRSVKIGIEAPKHINIVREELLEKAKEKVKQAVESAVKSAGEIEVEKKKIGSKEVEESKAKK